MRRLVLMLVSLVFEATLLLPGALSCLPISQTLSEPWYNDFNCLPDWPYNDPCWFTKNQPWTIVWPAKTDYGLTLTAHGGKGYSRSCSTGFTDGLTICWPNYRDPEIDSAQSKWRETAIDRKPSCGYPCWGFPNPYSCDSCEDSVDLQVIR